MNVIRLQDEAFYTLVDKVIQHIQESQGKKQDTWISGEEAMQKLRISSKTTLQKLRDEGKIRFSQPERKIILNDSDSIDAYLDKHSRKIF